MKATLFGMLAVLVTLPVPSAQAEDSIEVAAYYGGKQICAIQTNGSSPVTLKCCETATHDINIRRRYSASVSQSLASSEVWVTCIPIDREIANTLTGG